MALTRLTANSIGSNAVAADELSATGVVAGTYGNSTNIPQFTVDEDGRLISASNVNITDLSVNTVTTQGDLTVGGNLVVAGTTITVNTETVLLHDNIVTLMLNSNAQGPAAENAGLEVERGDDPNVYLRWNETLDQWQTTSDGINFYEILTADTDLSSLDLGPITELSTVTQGTWNANLIDLTYGGTGAATAGAARQNLGLEIGVDVQAYSAELTGLASLTTTGLVVRTAAGSSTTRSITAGSGITVTNGSGLGGNVQIALTNAAVTINGNSLALGNTLTLDTDDINEGTSNRYYSNTLVKNLLTSLNSSIVPSADVTYDLGSPEKQWRDAYIGPGSLYINGKQVITDVSDVIEFKTDPDQDVRLKTTGIGDIELQTDSQGLIRVFSTLQIQDGRQITNSAGNALEFGVGIKTNTLTSRDTNTDLTLSGNGSGAVRVADDLVVTGNLTINGTTTTVNAEEINLADNIITLNSNIVSGTPTEDAGLRVNRGDSPAVSIRWNETLDRWQYTNNGSDYTSLVSATANTVTGINYDSATGEFSLLAIPNASLANSTITINQTAVSLGGSIEIDSLPNQIGNQGRYLTTDGTTAQWVNIQTGSVLTKSAEPPAIAADGDEWYETSTGLFFKRINDVWLQI